MSVTLVSNHRTTLFPHRCECLVLLFSCRVFGKDIQGRDCGDETSRWLTRYLGEENTFRLVHFEPQMKGRKAEESKPFPPPTEVNKAPLPRDSFSEMALYLYVVRCLVCL